jgi:hypothetical protein
LKKEFNILKKPYLPPRVEFEEIEVDEREMLLAGSDHEGSGSGEEDGGGDKDLDALDIDFSMDFVVNDEPQL